MMSQEFELMANDAPAIIGARGLDDVMQCIRYIVRTTVFSVPLDRGFAQTGTFIDAPVPHAAAADDAPRCVIPKNRDRACIS